MENVSVKDVILEKKIDGYRCNENDFVASQELTVTITLAEYRQLIANDATRKEQVDKANADKWSRESEIKALKEENEALRKDLCDMRRKTEGPNGPKVIPQEDGED